MLSANSQGSRTPFPFGLCSVSSPRHFVNNSPAKRTHCRNVPKLITLRFPPIPPSLLHDIYSLLPSLTMASQASAMPTAAMNAAKPAEIPRPARRVETKRPHITEEPVTRANWYKHVNWLNITLIVGLPIYGLIAAYWTPLRWQTAIFAVAYYFATGLGITAGESSFVDFCWEQS